MADLERNGKFLDNVGLAKLWSLIKGMFYTKCETDGLLDDKADADSVYTKTETDTALSSKVDKETGKGLSTNDYTTAEKNKLAGIASGAEVNVQSDWNQTNTSSDDYIKNKPSVYTKSEIDTALNGKQDKLTLPLSISNGGTGATTAIGAEYNILNQVANMDNTSLSDDRRFAICNQTKSATNGVFRWYKLSVLWNYIKGKADSVYKGKHYILLTSTKAIRIKVGGRMHMRIVARGGSYANEYGIFELLCNNELKSNYLRIYRLVGSYTYPAGSTDADVVKFKADNTNKYIYVYTENNSYGFSIDVTMPTTYTIDEVNIADIPSTASYEATITYDIAKRSDVMPAGFSYVTTGLCASNYDDNYAPLVLDRRHMVDSAIISGLKVASASRNELLNADRKSGYTITETYPASWGNVSYKSAYFDGAYSQSATKDMTAVTSTTPIVISVEGFSVANDVTYLVLYGHRFYNMSACLKIEVKAGGSWYTVHDYTESQQIVQRAFTLRTASLLARYKEDNPSWTSSYVTLTGLRLTMHTFSGLTYWGLSEIELRENRNTTGANWGVNALALRGGDLYGKLNLMYDSGAIASGEKGAVTGGTVYTALQGKQNTLTFDNAPTANSNNPVKSGGIKTALDGKVDYADTFVWTQPYNATAGSYAKVLSFPKGASLVLNITMTKYSNVSTSTVWLSASNSGQIKAWQLTDGGFAAPRTSSSPFLAFPYKNSETEGSETLKIQVVRCSCALSEITFHDTATVATGAIELQSIYKRQVERDNALSFNLPTSGTQSVNMSTYNDFVGQMTEDLETEAVIKLSNQSEGQVYNFTFTHNLNGGIAFTNSNASTVFCEIASEVPAGSTITLTSVSNTAGGWVAKVSNAGIVSSDGSVAIDWAEGVADLSVPVTPPNVVLNRSELDWENDRTLSIGMDAQAQSYSGDESEPYAYTDIGGLSQFKVDGGSDEYYHAVTAGTTYSINRSGTIVSYTPSVSGYVIICNLYGLSSRRFDFSDDNHKWVIKTGATSVSAILKDTVTAGSNQYIVGVIAASASSVSQFGDQSTVRFWEKYSARQTENIAICALATGKNTIAIGSSSYGSNSITIGKNSAESQRNCIVMGYSAKASAESAVLIGNSANTKASDTIAIGNSSKVGGRWSMAIGQSAEVSSVTYALAIGYSAKANGGWSVAIGDQAKTTDINSIAIGAYSKANRGIAIGRNSNAAYASDDSNLPYYNAKRFTAVEFTVGGETKLVIRGTYGENVTISVNGTQKTVTPPSNSQLMLCVVNDSSAGVMGKFVSDYPMADGKVAYCPNMQASSINGDNITGNYYAVWFRCDNIQSYVDALVNASTFSFLAYYKTSGTSYENLAIGYDSYALYDGIAIGRGAVAIRDSQVVIGNYSVADDDAQLIIGSGTAGNHRKNILTIDSKDRVHVRKVKEEGVYYCLDTSAQNIVMGDAIYVSGQDGQYIELPTSSSGVENGTTFRFVAKYACKIRQGGTIIADMAQGTFKEFIFIDGNWYVN